MSKHTPGPWIVTDDVSAHVIRGAEEPRKQGNVEFVFRDYVCSIWGGYHEADARLIAAAPELLEALEALIDMDVSYKRGPVVAGAVERAQAAIKKARGEA